MKHSREIFFSIDDRIIGYSDETQVEQTMKLLDPMPKLHILAKLPKDLSTKHGRIAKFNNKILLRMAKYLLAMEKLSSLTSNKKFAW